MHKAQYFFSLIVILGIGLSCQKSTDSSLTIKDHGEHKEYTIHFKEIRDSMSLELDNIVSDLEFVKLETDEECLLGRGLFYVTNEFILVQKFGHGILQFDRSGKFIRTLVKQGSGPTEYSRAGWTVDEDRQVLYMCDQRKKNYFLRFDLETGQYLGDLKKAIIGGSQEIEYVEDNVIMVIPFGRPASEENSWYLYYQDTLGQLQYGIKSPSNMYIRQGRTIASGHPIFRYQIYDVDTIFTVAKNDLIPFLTFDFGMENPPNNNYVGHKSLYMSFETKEFTCFYNFFITGIEKFEKSSSTSGAIAYYLLDKKKGKVFNQGSTFMNPTFHNILENDTQYLSFQPNGTFHYSYQAVDLLEYAELALTDPEFKDPYRSMLKEAVDGLTVEDNPVLLIGQFK